MPISRNSVLPRGRLRHLRSGPVSLPRRIQIRSVSSSDAPAPPDPPPPRPPPPEEPDVEKQRPPQPPPQPPQPPRSPQSPQSRAKDAEPDSALARRFEALAEDAVTASPSRASQLATDASASAAISEELKAALAARVAAADFSSTHAQAMSVSNLPTSAPKQARDIAAAPVWTGEESTQDTVLRMLVDKHRPARGGGSRGAAPVDLRPSRTLSPRRRSGGQRVLAAREQSADYALHRDGGGLTAAERADARRMFRERFEPAGRPAATVQALLSLADQRIEDAIARGQFRDLPRGAPVRRDPAASSPFVDTTEYFLNRIIQRQDIVPPWIEKQQDVAREVAAFRRNLRAEWRRHVARRVAAGGGGVEEQCRRAEAYARAEARLARAEARASAAERGEELPPDEEGAEKEGEGEGEGEGEAREVFRDPTWEKAESAYHELCIKNINDLTRSYNLMAPELAKKPYLSLKRELRRCYADVAGSVADEIRQRSQRPPAGKSALGGDVGGGVGGSLLRKLGAGDSAPVYDSPTPTYGFRQLWNDLWRRGNG